ncbi:hypothetical protein ACLI1A_02635 [Flavobacterium sp. RHBU_3]|uniref:hypothetical protein n=1 Tax=Flavobacterium sp. RHBU_3 TaxID=3391184 RepID=UPI00398565BB
MRKSFLVFIVFVTGIIAVACSVDNAPEINFHLEYMPTDSVSLPASMARGQTYPITMYYHRPNNCYYLNGFYYDKNTNTRTVAIENMVLDSDNCSPLDSFTADVATFNFEVPLDEYDSYLFRFYKGDDHGTDTYLEVEVPIEQ